MLAVFFIKDIDKKYEKIYYLIEQLNDCSIVIRLI